MCIAEVNLTDDGDCMLTCDRGDHEYGLHHHDGDGRNIWWYSDDWMPEVSPDVLEDGVR